MIGLYIHSCAPFLCLFSSYVAVAASCRKSKLCAPLSAVLPTEISVSFCKAAYDWLDLWDRWIFRYLGTVTSSITNRVTQERSRQVVNSSCWTWVAITIICMHCWESSVCLNLQAIGWKCKHTCHSGLCLPANRWGAVLGSLRQRDAKDSAFIGKQRQLLSKLFLMKLDQGACKSTGSQNARLLYIALIGCNIWHECQENSFVLCWPQDK